ncbi:hypothetical protein LCGC14_0879250 [marine sediment metagenome]|uniref:Uncharacterized protein n=1 Tax=marine sediment metagenome TaxID=412755 RepID=A0A0F9PN31_9ZZZZ
MKTSELFEQDQDFGYLYFELSRDEVEGEAEHIAQQVAERIGAEVVKVKESPPYHYGEYTFNPIAVILRVPLSSDTYPSNKPSIAAITGWGISLQASRDDWIKKATKVLRRLSRGKPHFGIPQVAFVRDISDLHI